MLKIVKVGGVTVATGVLVGLGVVGWIKFHPADETGVNSAGGSLALGGEPTPSPEASALDLKVAGPDSVDAAGGNPGSLLGGTNTSANSGGSNNGGGSGGSSTPAPSAKSAPGPAEFKQYEQYKTAETALFGDMIVGTGGEVVAGSAVRVHYRGWLTDGTLFDESYSRSTPYDFVMGAHRVIPGWEQGLMGMKVGGKRRLIVPSAQGYGSQGHPPTIPADAMLVFDVELVAVQ